MSHSDKPSVEEIVEELENIKKAEAAGKNANGNPFEDVAETATNQTDADEANTDSPDTAHSVETLQEKLAAAEQKATENWDTVVRLNADLENQRKRTEKQVEDAHKYAVQKFVEDLLPVIDSMEMGLAAEGDVESIREGIRLTQNMFNSVMEKFKIECVDPLGEKFNPELHQAMAMNPSDEYEEGHVSAVMQKGFTLSGRLVRPAMVMVVKN